MYASCIFGLTNDKQYLLAEISRKIALEIEAPYQYCQTSCWQDNKTYACNRAGKNTINGQFTYSQNYDFNDPFS